MTRRTTSTILVGLLVSLFVSVNAAAVSADAPCLLDSQGNCAVVMVAPNDVAIFSAPAYYDSARATNGSAVTPFAQRACTHPTVGFPTCYSLQDDGTWAREEWTIDASGASWVVIGTVTYDEMQTAIASAQSRATCCMLVLPPCDMP